METESIISIFILVIQLMLFVLLVGQKSLYWVYLWQLKEYRIDRMVDFLSTRSGRKATANSWNIIELCMLAALFIVSLDSVYLEIGDSMLIPFIIGALFLLLAVEVIRYARWRLFPAWTTKAVLLSILSASASLCIAFFFAQFMNSYLAMLVTVVIAPLVATFVVLLFQPVTAVQKQRIIEQATQKIEKVKPIVIGITGSYGKSTTKEFLAAILKQKYHVLATPKNVNVDIGVATTVIQELEDSHDVFIAEMGAYKQGEIDAICDIVSPIIGVLTAINAQHLALFGSLEMIQETKGELLRSLPSSGLAVVNKDIPACVEVAEESEARVKLFSVNDVAHAYATDIVVEPHAVAFVLHVGGQKVRVRTPLHGSQVVPSILAAATVADHLGMPIQQIASGIGKLKPVAGTMQLKNGRNHYYVIDDSYNSNPDGFIAALDYLAQFHGKRKIVITPGMHELGTETDKHHRTVGSYAAEVADRLVVTKRDFAKPLVDAAKQGGMQPSSIIVNDRPSQLIQKELADYTADDVILVEGRVHQAILSYLVQER